MRPRNNTITQKYGKSVSAPECPNGSRDRKRRPRAEATLECVLGSQRTTTRKLAGAALVMRLTPISLPVLLRFALHPLLDRRSVHIGGGVLSPEELLGLVVTAGVLVAILRATSSFLFVAWAGRCGHALVADLRQEMFEHILRMPCRYVDRRGPGKVLLRFIGDSDALRTWVSRTAPSILADRIVLGVLAATMVVIDWRLAFVMLIPIALLWAASRFMAHPLLDLTREARQTQAKFTGHVESRIANLRQAKWFDRHRKNRLVTRSLVDHIADLNTARDRQAAVLRGTGQLLAFLSIPLTLGVGIGLVWQQGLEIGQFIAFAWLGAHAAVVVHRLNDAVVVRQKANVSIERILKLLERRAERGRSSGLPELSPESCSLRIEKLVFSSSGIGAADHPLDFDCRDPGVFPIDDRVDVDALYECLLGFRRPSGGRIVVGDQPLDEVQIQSLRQATAWVPSRPAIFEGTVLDNIRLAAPHLGRRERERIVERFLDGRAGARLWLDREAGVGGSRLSAEDMVLISVVRAAVSQPRFVLVENFPRSDATVACLRELVAFLGSRALILLPDETAQEIMGPASEVALAR